jgi:2-keto-4-pentenoate hydratase/2-oxohepta-3-ene-1,7-dioic acid hydratase in catechol pathway
MKILRYELRDETHYGLLEGDRRIARLIGSPFAEQRPEGAVDDLDAVRVLAPVDRPRIFGLGYNYVSHTKETGQSVPDLPVLFMKPSTCVIGSGEQIVYPAQGANIHFEGELTVVIGKEARHVSECDALKFVLGYTCGNDVSDRVLQRRESQFGCLLMGKGYDTFGPIGPVIETDLDPLNARIVSRVNGEVRQDGNTKDMLFSVPYIISYLSKHLTLLPGDMIMTGTPAGVGPIVIGDVIEIEIDGIGVLTNRVVDEAR